MSDFTVSSPPAAVVLFAMLGHAPPGPRSFGESKELSLENHIASAEWQAFKKRKDVPVTTVVLEPRGEFETGIWSTGEVNGGNLTVRIAALGSSSLPSRVVVSWTVDTRRPNG